MSDEKPKLPPLLYRYRSLRGESFEHTLDIFKNLQLYWTNPADFNDPFDCRPSFIYQGSKIQHRENARLSANLLSPQKNRQERRKIAARAEKRKPAEISSNMQNQNESMMRSIRMCCFSEDPANLLMWSHYSDSHRGICIGFEPYLDIEKLGCVFRVTYRPDRPSINIMDRGKGEESLKSMLLSKSSDWSYEKEWRAIDQRSNEPFKHFPSEALTQVILGAAIGDEHREKVLKVIEISKCSPRIFQAMISASKFELIFEEI